MSGALDRVFRGEDEFEAAMSAYQQERDRATGRVYAVNYECSKLAVAPEHLEALRALAEARIAAARTAGAG